MRVGGEGWGVFFAGKHPRRRSIDQRDRTERDRVVQAGREGSKKWPAVDAVRRGDELRRMSPSLRDSPHRAQRHTVPAPQLRYPPWGGGINK